MKNVLANWLMAIAIGLQGWTLNEVSNVKERLARLEARYEYLPRRDPAAASAAVKSGTQSEKLLHADCNGKPCGPDDSYIRN